MPYCTMLPVVKVKLRENAAPFTVPVMDAVY
jgi:hypothetical protein